MSLLDLLRPAESHADHTPSDDDGATDTANTADAVNSDDHLGYLRAAKQIATLALVRPTSHPMSCVKCGHDASTLRYCNADPDDISYDADDPHDCSALMDEHLHVTCDRCGAKHFQRTLETVSLALEEIALYRAEQQTTLTTDDEDDLAAAEAILHKLAAADALLP